jgi:hypothetical protein
MLMKIGFAGMKHLSSFWEYGFSSMRNRPTGVGSLLTGYPFFCRLFLFLEVNNNMKELTEQVKRELFRTLFWVLFALSVSIALYYLIW